MSGLKRQMVHEAMKVGLRTEHAYTIIHTLQFITIFPVYSDSFVKICQDRGTNVQFTRPYSSLSEDECSSCLARFSAGILPGLTLLFMPDEPTSGLPPCGRNPDD